MPGEVVEEEAKAGHTAPEPAMEPTEWVKQTHVPVRVNDGQVGGAGVHRPAAHVDPVAPSDAAGPVGGALVGDDLVDDSGAASSARSPFIPMQSE